MDKDKDHEAEWLEAQKMKISVDLFSAAKQQLQFLATVDKNRWLYEGPALERAIYRYNACWLPLLAKYSDSSVNEGPLVPPLDCEWIWHCHRLNPVRYKSDCEEFYGRLLDNSGVVSSVNGNCKSKTEALWKELYPEEPYDLDLNKVDSEEISEKSSTLEKCTKYDLVSAVKRQSPFYYQVSRSHVDNDIFLQEAVARYKGFIYLIKKNRERSLNRFCVPTYDVDHIWHTHQLHPVSYCDDMKKLIGKVLEHDDTDSDRGKGKKLDKGFSMTTSQWEETFGTRYWKAGAMYRGKTPTPVTNSPYASDGLVKEPTTKKNFQNLIQFPEVEAVEVLLEITGVRNLPDGHKGKLLVVFSKTQPDSLFNAERKLTILSEVGEKQVASFHCEPTGELCFKLVSSSPSKIPVSREPKTLGFASLSLKEFLFPTINQLSVEKWLDLTPSKGSKTDQRPINLRVAISFTPPVHSPSVLHMVQSRSSYKGSCFFPIMGKSHLTKNSAHIVDETQTEVISLQMSSSTDGATLKDDQIQVIGVIDSAETHVLAETTGSFWSLLDSKWFLKQSKTSAANSPLFELMGPRVVKIFSGRKLDYEPKHCANLRNDQDFMTLVEFSKQYPYGKAVGLLDLKTGSIEAKENWLVLPGIISAFILNTVLKKGGFNGFNATTKEIKEEKTKLVSAVGNKVETNTTDAATTAVITASEKGSGECGNMVKATNASGCGSGCSRECGDMIKTTTNASGCGGGCSGECGNMMRATTASGCSGGCSGECRDMVKTSENASGCGSGCNGECGNMVKASNASGCGSGCSGECGGDMVKTVVNASGCGGGSSGECEDMVKAAKASGCGGGSGSECGGDMLKAAKASGCGSECGGDTVKAAKATGCGGGSGGCGSECGGDMLKATKASGCGSECGGDTVKAAKASGCGGGSGGCGSECGGDMLKAAKASGCGSECGGDTVKAAKASGCGGGSGGCGSECGGDMLKAAKASGCGSECGGDTVKAAKASGCGGGSGGCGSECGGDMLKAAKASGCGSECGGDTVKAAKASGCGGGSGGCGSECGGDMLKAAKASGCGSECGGDTVKAAKASGCGGGSGGCGSECGGDMLKAAKASGCGGDGGGCSGECGGDMVKVANASGCGGGCGGECGGDMVKVANASGCGGGCGGECGGDMVKVANASSCGGGCGGECGGDMVKAA